MEKEEKEVWRNMGLNPAKDVPPLVMVGLFVLAWFTVKVVLSDVDLPLKLFAFGFIVLLYFGVSAHVIARREEEVKMSE